MIAGDAAHLMPPFAGEGMCAGFRDAVALGWRLNAILDGTIDADVLDSYESERIHHAKHYIDFSQELGNIICVSDPEKVAERDRTMMAELAARNYEPISGDHCNLGSGIWCDETPAAGELSTQGVVTANGKTALFDQAVGQGWFIVGVNADCNEILDANQKTAWNRLGGQCVTIGSNGTSWEIIDVDGTYAKWMNDIDATYFILRPDFYVAATAKTKEDLTRHLDKILSRLYINTYSPVPAAKTGIQQEYTNP